MKVRTKKELSQPGQAENSRIVGELASDQELLDFFIKKGFLLDKSLINFFIKLGDKEICSEILEKIAAASKTRIITKTMVAVHFSNIKPLLSKLEEKKKEVIKGFFKTLPRHILNLDRKEERQEITSIEERESVAGEKLSNLNQDFEVLSPALTQYRKIEVRDFVAHFKNRYNFLRDVLKTRAELKNLISIDKISGSREVSVIGMVSNKRTTKNKNILLELEDPTGRITAIINQNKPELFEKAKEIVLDDVLGLNCAGGKEILFVNSIVFPDASLQEKKRAEKEIYSLFISDIHLGSINFLEENFSKFIEWLNSKDEKAKKIKYLFILGDNVDGVGVYPSQETLLKIKDLKEQYFALARYLDKVPKHITIFMCPGQHDSVRVPEPQPPLDKDFAEPLLKIKNLVLVSNPALVRINCSDANGFKVLMYHGASLANWINSIDELRTINAFKAPAKVVKYLLRHRHLSPTHSATTYVPGEKEDATLIKEIPDIFAFGDLHKPDIDIYNNILIIAGGCWQSTTPYEEKLGNYPDPCKAPLLNLKTREIKILDFS